MIRGQYPLVHIAGVGVLAHGPTDRFRQRCAWCGEILIDDDLGARVMLAGRGRGPARFPEGALVELDAGDPESYRPRRVSLVQRVGQALPANACTEARP